MKSTSSAFNSIVLSKFNQEIYKDILDETCIMGDEVCLSDKETTGYKFRKSQKIYFVPTDYMDNLPIRIKDTQRVIDKSNVYWLVKEATSVKIDGENTMTFKELVDTMCHFSHTNPKHFALYKLMCIAAYVDKTHWRLATKVSFGKNSMVDALRDLTNNCARIDKATPAKLDYVLKFPFILLNEVANLKREEKEVFLQFAISVGDRSNKYTKPTRKSSGTKEIYDISKLSLCFTYNIAEYFWDKRMDSFDDYFPDNVLDRYIPFKFEGYLEVNQFKRQGQDGFDAELEAKKHKGLYIKVLKKLYWITEHPIRGKYKLSEETFSFDKGRYRWKNEFLILANYVSAYAQSKEEFDELCLELYNSHRAYINEELSKDGRFMKEEVIK